MLLLYWLCTIVLAIEVSEVPNPQEKGLWVVDMVDIIDSESEARINAIIEQLNRDSTVEIALVTVDNVPASAKEFSTALFNHWGIGDAKLNNGLLILVVMEQRRLEMETGYGLEVVLSTTWLQNMQSTYMIPFFKKGDFAKGLENGIIVVDTQLRTKLNLENAALSKDLVDTMKQRMSKDQKYKKWNPSKSNDAILEGSDKPKAKENDPTISKYRKESEGLKVPIPTDTNSASLERWKQKLAARSYRQFVDFLKSGVGPCNSTDTGDNGCCPVKATEDKTGIDIVNSDGMILTYYDLTSVGTGVGDINSDGNYDRIYSISSEGGGCGGNVGWTESFYVLGHQPKNFSSFGKVLSPPNKKYAFYEVTGIQNGKVIINYTYLVKEGESRMDHEWESLICTSQFVNGDLKILDCKK
jgi:hypothetical protein